MEHKTAQQITRLELIQSKEFWKVTIANKLFNHDYSESVGETIAKLVVDDDFMMHLKELSSPVSDDKWIDAPEILWDEYSEHVDEDIHSLQDVAGTTIMKRGQFLKLFKEKFKAPTQ